jgi:hypothetical protein
VRFVERHEIVVVLKIHFGIDNVQRLIGRERASGNKQSCDEQAGDASGHHGHGPQLFGPLE